MATSGQDEALIAAIRAGDVDGVRAAMAAGAHAYARSGTPDWRRSDVGWPALALAVGHGHLEIARLLLDAGANAACEFTDHVPGERSIDEVARTPLELALNLGRDDLALLLLERGAKANAWDGLNGQSVLSLAAGKGMLVVVKQLVAHDARDPEAVVAAAQNGHLEVVRELVACVPPTTRALAQACYHGNREIAELLVESGANINGADALTPLQAAAWGDHVEILEWLLQKGADLSRSGAHALELAASAGHARAVRMLLERGVPIETRNSFGWTPLMLAAYQGKLEIVRCLLELGADRTATDRDGKRAIDWARQAGHADVVALLPR